MKNQRVHTRKATRLYKIHARFRKRKRLLFPSPAEIDFIRLMGGKAIVIDHVKNPFTKFPLTFVTSMGDELEREYVQREVRVGAMYIDFGVQTPYYKKGIEIDGKNFHRDIIAEQRRDKYVRDFGWDLLHIQADVLRREPKRVHDLVLDWLKKP